MKGGLLLASLLLAFSGNVLGVTEAFDLSSTMFLSAVRATQVGATVNVLSAKAMAVLAEIDVIGSSMTDCTTINTMDGARFVLLSKVPALTALSYINFVEWDISNDKVTK